jgi:hypothetical protein
MQVGPLGAGGVNRPIPLSRYSEPAPDIEQAMQGIVKEYLRAMDIEGEEGKAKAGFLNKEGKNHVYSFTARYKNRSTALKREVLEKVLRDSPTLKKYNLKASVGWESLVTPDAEIVVERSKPQGAKRNI